MDTQSNIISFKDKVLEKNQKPQKFTMLVIIIAIIILLSSLYGIFQYFQPSTTVILDSPRRIYININSYNRVINVEPLRDNSTKVVDNIELFNSDINEALEKIISYCESTEIIDESYFPNKKTITIFITSKDNSTLDLTKFNNYMNTKKLKLSINQNGFDYK